MSKIFTKPFHPLPWDASPQDFAKAVPDVPYMGIYTVESTQRFTYGTRYTTWDGRVFKYAKVNYIDIINIEAAVKSNPTAIAIKAAVGAYTNVVTMPSVDAGAQELIVTFTAATLGNVEAGTTGLRTGVIAEDELAAGYIAISTTAGYPSTMQNRGILGNTAVAATDESMILYLDAPLNTALVSGTSLCTIHASPYAGVCVDNTKWASNVGMPMRLASIGKHIWIQSWGPIRIIPIGGNRGETGQERQFVFNDMGGIIPTSPDATTVDYQHAGFLIERSEGSANIACPLIMLQIST